jgi:hypothetical protein
VASPHPLVGNERRVADIVNSLIRTWVPIGVGAALAWVATSRHIIVPPHASAAVGVFAASVCASGYYGLARALEHARGDTRRARLARALGRWMLGGVIGPPVYPNE